VAGRDQDRRVANLAEKLPKWWNNVQIKTVVRLAAIWRVFCIVSGMTAIDDARELSVTEATKRGVAGLVADAELGEAVVVTRHHRAVAAVISIRQLRELEEATADLRDLALVLARAATDTGRRTPLDDVLDAFGHTRESLAAIGGDE
jgi:antitoxin (DNA-binding transcriptional repressor) of toxin-antitoxin stability system